jgi:hypothetical protein
MVDAVGKCGVRGNVELWDDAYVETRFASCMQVILRDKFLPELFNAGRRQGMDVRWYQPRWVSSNGI